jgi:putative nucleotidyltransferase with HDIG domain
MTDQTPDQTTRQIETVSGETGKASRSVSGRWSRLPVVVRFGLFALVTLLVTVATVLVDFTPAPTVLRPGDIARDTYKAPFATTYVSAIRTEDLRKAAHDSVANIVHTHDETVLTTQQTELQRLLENITEIRAESISEADKVLRITELSENISPATATDIVRLDTNNWNRVVEEANRVLTVVLSEEIRSDEVDAVRSQVPDRVSQLRTAVEQDIIVSLVDLYVRPNVFIDDRATEERRRAAAAAVEPVVVSVQDGQAIVRDGDIVSRTDVEMMEALGMFSTTGDGLIRAGKAGIMAILTIILVVYLYSFVQSVSNSHQLMLLLIIMLTPVVIARFILPNDDIQFMFPAALSAMLISILLSFQLAVIVSIILAFYLGVVAGMSFELTAVYFVGALAGAFVIHRAERTITFVWSGVAVTASTFIAALCFRLLEGNLTSADVASLLIQTSIAGALAASVTFLSFSVLGSIFGITTHLQLLDLLRPNQPLLNRMAREAPGTYHHSIIVSNLAESAATIVGGDALLTRVAVLYHDIGKLEHPTFFIENQANIGNVHDHLDPKVSARVIIDHVADGYAMGKKARLPQPVLDIIQQHHGTTLVKFFYTKALNAGMDVSEEEFRYPGPKPQTKEAAIVMLADSVEAAVRSVAQSGKLFERAEAGDRRSESDKLREFVHNIIDQRVTDGQLSECDLTLRDIDGIKSSFIQILEGIYHPRVEYPAAGQVPVEPVAAPAMD